MKRKQKEPQRYMYKKGIYGVQLATTHRKAVQDSLLTLFRSIPKESAVFNTGRHLPRLKFSFNSIPR